MNRIKIENQFKKELGLPIKIGAFETNWLGFDLCVHLKDVIISTKEDIPIVTLHRIQLQTNVWRIAFNPKFTFSHITLEGLKAILKLEKDHSISILGLKGENLSTQDHHFSRMRSLLKNSIASFDKISIHKAQLLWKTNSTKIFQYIDGQIKIIHSGNPGFEFKGNHILKIGDKRSLPKIEVFLKQDSKKEAWLLETKFLGTSLNCQMMSSQKTMECRGTGDNINIGVFTPIKSLDNMLPRWVDYLLSSLERGVITAYQFKLAGQFDHLRINGKVDFKGIDFRFDPNWPKIENSAGTVNILDNQLFINLHKGNLFGENIENTSSVIQPLNEKAVVTIQGELDSRLETGLKFLNDTPLQDSIAKKLKPLNPFGPMHLKLNLQIPLEPDKTSKVEGIVSTTKGQLFIPDFNIPLYNIKGNFKFTEDNIEAKKFTVEILDRLASGDIINNILSLNTKIDISDPKYAPYLQSISNYFKGSTEINMTVPLKDPKLNIESRLKGLEILLPQPFAKTKLQEQPFFFTLYPIENKERRFSFHWNNSLDAKGTLSYDEKNHLFLKQGHFVFGKNASANWKNKDTFLISGNIEKLDVDEWWTFFANQKISPSKRSFKIDLFANQLDILGFSFNQTKLDTTLSKAPLSFGLEGPALKGIIRIDEQSKVDLSFKRLDLSVFKYQDDIKALNKIQKPYITFVCDEFRIGEKLLGNVRFNLNPIHLGYELQNLSAKTNAFLLTAAGKWQVGDRSLTHIQGKIQSSNMGLTFKQLGLTSAIQHSYGNIRFGLQWEESPLQFDWSLVKGNMHLEMYKGQILGINPGMSRFFGLLNVENIGRRLQLDFSDVFKKGFAFDSLLADIIFRNGAAFTDGFIVEGPLAKVELKGSTELKTKALDVDIIVTPKIGWELPLGAAALAAGNPIVGAVGAGAWAFNKILGRNTKTHSTRSKARPSYHITGTWDAPRIQEIKK